MLIWLVKYIYIMCDHIINNLCLTLFIMNIILVIDTHSVVMSILCSHCHNIQ